MPLNFVKSERGKYMLVHDGFLYRFESKNDKKTIWKCVENLKKKCKARIHTDENSILSDVTKISHVHFPDIAKIEAKRAMENLKELAKKTELSTQSVVATVASELNTAVSGQMPGIPLMKRTILRVRERENAAPGIPQSLYDLVIPEEYKKTSDGKSFLLFDSFDHDPDNCDRFLLFSTEENLQKMSECDHWYADGTFSCAPSIFKQLYTIHGIQCSNVLPSVYALLPNKKKKTYIRLLQSLKTLNCNLKPKTVMLDFEIGAMTAFKKEFSDMDWNLIYRDYLTILKKRGLVKWTGTGKGKIQNFQLQFGIAMLMNITFQKLIIQ